jgi:pantoate--beta-alanine ligase
LPPYPTSSNTTEALKILETQAELISFLKAFRSENTPVLSEKEAELNALRGYSDHNKKKIGFVPTMGALHKGHISLIEQAAKENDIVVCSIFINPTQFNDPADFDRYPRVVSADVAMLEKCGCDVLFLPAVKEIYPDDSYKLDIDFGAIEKSLEGKFRPGHFKGVGMVVKRLLEMVQPDSAYFGLKDYQQFRIIQKLKEIYSMPVKLVGMPTIREEDGLAMSSRNTLLTPEDRKKATLIYKVLKETKNNFESSPPVLLVENAIKQFRNNGLDPEYFQVCEAENLEPAIHIEKGKKYVALVAVFIGKVRLIDNLELN